MTLRGLRAFLAVFVALAVVIGVDNLARPLANPDEGRYSEISREMAASGDWVTPRLNGIKYFEKPPLQYWASAIAIRLFGPNEYAARIYTWLAALATVLLVGFTASRLGTREAGMASMLALVASPYFLALGGVVTLDMGLTLWTTATVSALLLAERSGSDARARRRWMLAAWAAMALAVLSKGLVGIVFAGAAVFFHIVVRRDLSILRRMEWMRGLAVFAALAAPWFILVSRANPEFAHFFFVHEHFQRFLTTAHRRAEPWWYFLPIMALGFLPWMFALPGAIRRGWSDETLRVTLLWAAFVVLFFSASGSKLPTYVLPAFPILALPLGRYLAEAPPRRLALWIALALPVGVALLAAAYLAPDLTKDAWRKSMLESARGWMLAAAAIFLAALATASVLMWRGRRWLAIVVVAIGAVLLIDCLEDAYEEFSPRQSGLAIARKMQPLLAPATRVYSVKIYDQTVPFYIGRTVKLVDYVDEFETGLRAEPGSHLERIEEFAAEWRRPGDALAIMQPGNFEEFQRQGLPMQVLHQDPRRVLVRKP